MTTYHQNIPDQYLHEPKGIVNAVEGAVYIADGVGSGNWVAKEAYIHGYIDFDSATPAYQHTVTNQYTPLNPSFLTGPTKNFTGTATPNARLIYTGSEDIVAKIVFTFNCKNQSGSAKDLEMVFYRNGTVMNGGHLILTAQSGEWVVASLSDLVTLNQNDYVEVMVKGTDTFTLDVAGGSLIIQGVD